MTHRLSLRTPSNPFVRADLATVLAAERKLYLLYSNHDLQKDQTLQPSVPLQQLQRHLSRHILKSEFAAVAMPTQGDDPRFHDGHPDLTAVYDADLVRPARAVISTGFAASGNWGEGNERSQDNRWLHRRAPDVGRAQRSAYLDGGWPSTVSR